MRTTLILFAILAGIGGYAYFVEYKGTEKKEATKKENAKLFQLSNISDANRIILSWASARTVLVKEGADWKIIEPVADQAEATAMETLLGAIKEEMSEDQVEDGEKLSLDKYGLTDPLGSVEVLTTSGEGQKIEFGTQDGIGGIKYVHLVGKKKIVTVNAMTQTKLQKTARDLREKRIYLFEPQEIQKIEFSGQTSFVLEKKESGWSYKGREWAVDQSKVDQFAQMLTQIRAEEVISENKSEKESAAKYGTSKSVLSVSVSTKDGKTHNLLAHTTKDGKGYLTRDVRPQVYQVPANVLESIRVGLNDFRDKKAPFRFDASQVEEIEIRSSASKLTLKKSPEGWIENPKVAGKKVSRSKIESITKSFQTLEAMEFVPSVKGQTLGSVLMKASDGKPVFKFEYGREQGKDGRIVTTNLNSDVMVVSKSAIASLKLEDIFEDPAAPNVEKTEPSEMKDNK